MKKHQFVAAFHGCRGRIRLDPPTLLAAVQRIGGDIGLSVGPGSPGSHPNLFLDFEERTRTVRIDFRFRYENEEEFRIPRLLIEGIKALLVPASMESEEKPFKKRRQR
ncbi:MAG: hypothetical protein WDN10_00390 [bacterium]